MLRAIAKRGLSRIWTTSVAQPNFTSATTVFSSQGWFHATSPHHGTKPLILWHTCIFDFHSLSNFLKFCNWNLDCHNLYFFPVLGICLMVEALYAWFCGCYLDTMYNATSCLYLINVTLKDVLKYFSFGHCKPTIYGY